MTGWSTWLLGKHLGWLGCERPLAKAWRDFGSRPWRAASFRFSNDLQLVTKVVVVVGLYLSPPENAIVFSVDEKSQIHAWSGPRRSCRPCQGRPSVAATTTSGTAPRPCSPPDGSHRVDRRRSQATAPGNRSSWPFSSRSPAPTPRASCTW
jgi:hypothetical protein